MHITPRVYVATNVPRISEGLGGVSGQGRPVAGNEVRFTFIPPPGAKRFSFQCDHQGPADKKDSGPRTKLVKILLIPNDTTGMSAMDQRTRTRISYLDKAQVRTASAVFVDLLCRDLSLKGAFIMGSAEVRPGDKIEVMLMDTEETKDFRINIRGKVVRKTGEGFAVSFYQFDETSFLHVKRLVEYRSGDSDLIERELTHQAFGQNS